MRILIAREYSETLELSENLHIALNLEWPGYDDLGNKDFGIEDANVYAYRAHPSLIFAVEKIGLENSAVDGVILTILEIPNGIIWGISENEKTGEESIHEVHRSWWAGPNSRTVAYTH